MKSTRVLSLLRSASPQATGLTVVALVLLTIKILVLNRIPAFVSGLYDVGLVLEAVLASVVASYVFYVFVIHIKEAGDKAAVAPYFNRHTLRVVGECESQLSEISKVSGIQLELDNVSLTRVTQAFTNIAPYSNAPLVLSPTNTHANWFQYFDFHLRRSKESISRVFGQLIYLDAKHVGLLAEIDDCSHFSIVPEMLHQKVGNADLSAFASVFYSYCAQCRELKQYMSKKTSRGGVL